MPASTPGRPTSATTRCRSSRRRKALGLEVGCYVVNDPVRMQFLADTGLWGFVTDVPDVAVQTLGRS